MNLARSKDTRLIEKNQGVFILAANNWNINFQGEKIPCAIISTRGINLAKDVQWKTTNQGKGRLKKTLKWKDI